MGTNIVSRGLRTFGGTRLWGGAVLLCMLLPCCGTTRSDARAPHAPIATVDFPAPVSAPPLRAKVVKLVSSLPRRGSAARQTDSIVDGIHMAIAEHEAARADSPVTYEDWDDSPTDGRAAQWDVERELANANQAAADDRVVVYLGPYNSGAAKISMPVLNRARLAMISPANTYFGLTKPGLGEAGEPDVFRPTGTVNYFRVVPTDDVQGVNAASWISALAGKRVFVTDDGTLYGKGVADAFEKATKGAAISVLGRAHLGGAASLDAAMSQAKQANPDWIYFGGTTQTGGPQLVKAVAASGLGAKVMTSDGCFDDEFVAATGPAAEGRVYSTFGGLPPEKLAGNGAEFVARYRKTYGREPTPYAVYGYVAAKVAIEAVDHAEKRSRAGVLSALAKTTAKDGELGTWHFDPNGDTTSTLMSGSVVRHGKFEFETVLGH
jgi:branched-chain amino acid transport system substrate-binding protein